MSEVILISNARLSWPHLVEPQKTVSPETGQTRISYNCSLILEKDDPGFQVFMKQYAEMAQEKWKAHANQIMQMIHGDKRQRCYGAGEEVINKTTMQVYDGYAGKVYLNAGNTKPPQVIDATGNPIPPDNTMAIQQTLRKMYGGCRVNVAVKPWLQENKYGRGVRCDLVAVQFSKDDVAFGEGAFDASGMFGAVAQAPGAAPTPTAMPPLPFGNGAAVPGMPTFLK